MKAATACLFGVFMTVSVMSMPAPTDHWGLGAAVGASLVGLMWACVAEDK